MQSSRVGVGLSRVGVGNRSGSLEAPVVFHIGADPITSSPVAGRPGFGLPDDLLEGGAAGFIYTGC
jgi:hypothetical protein